MNEPVDKGAEDRDVGDTVMDLLHDHVPLTLLVDLVDAPRSEQVLRDEGMPEQEWWEQVPHQADPSD